MPPSKEKLEQLHDLLTQELLKRIQEGEATPALLNVARQFLRDNGIESLALPGSPLGDLLSQLPTFEIEEMQ